jgi:hypothetical protein
MMKLGKTPARPGAVTFKLVDYLTALPKPPTTFGHETLIPTWGMNGNDAVGDCVIASKAHLIEMWNAEAGRPVVVTTKDSLADYSAITGYDPTDPNSDQGTDMSVAASYFRKTGYRDSAGTRHKIGAYLSITPGNWSEHLQALYLFGAVEIGINFPASAMAQFNAGKEWSYNSRSKIEGGHCIPLVAHRTPQSLTCVTWGALERMTPRFFTAFNDESLVYLSPEMLTGGRSPEGFNLAQLQADLSQLH